MGISGNLYTLVYLYPSQVTGPMVRPIPISPAPINLASHYTREGNFVRLNAPIYLRTITPTFITLTHYTAIIGIIQNTENI